MIEARRIKFNKKFTFSYPEERTLRHIARRGFAMIKDRITKRQVLADGSKLPALKRTGRVYVKNSEAHPGEDRRVPGVSMPTNRTIEGGRIVDHKPGKGGKAVGTMYLAGGLGAYARRKQRRGAQPVRDGSFTGAMWSSPRANVTRVGDLVRLTVGFRGSSKAGKVRTRNHDKAFFFTRIDRQGRRTKAPQFLFMAWNAVELHELAAIAVGAVKLTRPV